MVLDLFLKARLMTATNHALTGALVATVVKQPWLAVPLAFASHFVCDAIPHFGANLKFPGRAMYTWLVIDGFTALFFAIFLIYKGVENPVLLAICGFVAMSPDLAWLYYGLKGQLSKLKSYDPISKFHSKIQLYQKPPGLVIEFIWAFLMVTLIIKLQ